MGKLYSGGAQTSANASDTYKSSHQLTGLIWAFAAGYHSLRANVAYRLLEAPKEIDGNGDLSISQSILEDLGSPANLQPAMAS